MSEQDRRAIYAAQAAIENLSQQLSFLVETIERLNQSMVEVGCQVQTLNEHMLNENFRRSANGKGMVVR